MHRHHIFNKTDTGCTQTKMGLVHVCSQADTARAWHRHDGYGGVLSIFWGALEPVRTRFLNPCPTRFFSRYIPIAMQAIVLLVLLVLLAFGIVSAPEPPVQTCCNVDSPLSSISSPYSSMALQRLWPKLTPYLLNLGSMGANSETLLSLSSSSARALCTSACALNSK